MRIALDRLRRWPPRSPSRRVRRATEPAPAEQAAGRRRGPARLRPGRASSPARAASRRRSATACGPQGFEYVPVDPFAQRAAVLGTSRLTRRGVPAAVRLRHQHAVGPRPRRRRPERAHPPARSARPTGGPTTARCGARTRARPSPRRSTPATSPSSGGCTREATEAGFGGAQVLTQLQAQARRARGAHPAGPADGAGDRDVVGVHGRGRASSTTSRRRSTATCSSAWRRIVGPLPGQFATGPGAGRDGRGPYDRAALAELQRDEVAIARADFACEEKHITPVEEEVAPQYADEFRRAEPSSSSAG